MGNSYSSTLASTDIKVTIEVSALKARLNRYYSTNHLQARSHDGLFDYLWDLKERALIEGRDEVEVPANWLNDLDDLAARTH